MNDSDKLRFELGLGFTRLTDNEVDQYWKEYDEILDIKEEEYGYAGDSPFYAAVREFTDYLLELELDDEDFIQVLKDCFGSIGWALNQIKNPEIVPYAKKHFYDLLKNHGWDADDIDAAFDSTNLPC